MVRMRRAPSRGYTSCPELSRVLLGFPGQTVWMRRRALQLITFTKMGSLVKPNAADLLRFITRLLPRGKNNLTMASAHGSVIRGSLGVSELSGLLAEDAMDLLGRAGAADRVGELQRI